MNSSYGVNGIAHVSILYLDMYCPLLKCLLNIIIYSQNAGPSPSPLGQMPPNDGMQGGPMPGGFFPVS